MSLVSRVMFDQLSVQLGRVLYIGEFTTQSTGIIILGSKPLLFAVYRGPYYPVEWGFC